MIATDRLNLRRARDTDLQDLHRVFSDPRAMRYWSRPEHDDIADTRTYLAELISATGEGADEFVMEHQGRVIGKCGAWSPPEIGFILHPDFWRQGLMREALQALIPHLFATHGLTCLTAEVDPRNAGSLGLLQALGFVETHRASRTLLWRDEWCDSIYLRLPAP